MENRDKNPSEPCDICGVIGIEELIMTCLNCRDVREHIYCAKVCLQSVPDMWLCQVCRSSARVLQISNLVDSDCRASRPETSSKFSGKGTSYTSPRKKRRPQFLAFPSPKRKPRTLRIPVEDIEEYSRQGPQSSHPCVFQRID